MCVILVCETKRPGEKMVERAWARNSDGGGVAWREGGYVRWKKGLTEGEMQDFAKTLPFPFVQHYRVKSSGIVHPTLCHPFPVTKDASTVVAGKIRGGAVLFHNGTWADYKKNCLEAVIRRDVKIPNGLWMDSRAMAWLAALYGTGILEFIDEKACVLGTEGKPEIFGAGWSEEDGILMSNRLFLNGTVLYNRPDVRETRTEPSAGGSSAPATFPATDIRRSGSSVPTGSSVAQQVQEGHEVAEEGHREGEAKTGLIHNGVTVTPVLSALNPIQAAHDILSDPRLAVISEADERNRRLEAHRKGIVTPAEAARENRRSAFQRGITLMGRY